MKDEHKDIIDKAASSQSTRLTWYYVVPYMTQTQGLTQAFFMAHTFLNYATQATEYRNLKNRILKP